MRVTVDGLTDDQIREIAERAKANCPVSRALAGVDITLDLPDLAPPPEEEAPNALMPRPKPETFGRGRGAAAAARLGAVMAGFEDLIDELERSYREAAGAHVRPDGLQRPPRGERRSAGA